MKKKYEVCATCGLVTNGAWMFKTELVRRIIANVKIMTRREPFFFESTKGENPHFLGYVMPRHKVGDIIYVRETFYPQRVVTAGVERVEYRYLADIHSEYRPDNIKWKPSIFMPKAAARIFLRITGVRCERLQDISHEDAIAEGITSTVTGVPPYDLIYRRPNCPNYYYTHEQAFQALWDSLNAKCDYRWETNPWVFVYEFERCEAKCNRKNPVVEWINSHPWDGVSRVNTHCADVHTEVENGK
jgi:hypothetical protein